LLQQWLLQALFYRFRADPTAVWRRGEAAEKRGGGGEEGRKHRCFQQTTFNIMQANDVVERRRAYRYMECKCRRVAVIVVGLQRVDPTSLCLSSALVVPAGIARAIFWRVTMLHNA
jgi:hypothetical protein